MFDLSNSCAIVDATAQDEQRTGGTGDGLTIVRNQQAAEAAIKKEQNKWGGGGGAQGSVFGSIHCVEKPPVRP